MIRNPSPEYVYLAPAPTYEKYGLEPIYCVCHGSQYDPLVLVKGVNPKNVEGASSAVAWRRKTVRLRVDRELAERVADFGTPHNTLMRALAKVSELLEETADGVEGRLPGMFPRQASIVSRKRDGS